MSLKGTNFSIKSVDDLIRCLSLASLLELGAWPKPGNIHRTRDFERTRFEHFLAGITAIQPNFREFCENIMQTSFKNEGDFERIRIGKFFKKAAEEMMKWQRGGNVLLGHILILAPLAAASAICLKTKKFYITDLRKNLIKVIDNASVDDTINLFKAIRLCNPGGLGTIEKYDINNEGSLNEIISDNIKLKKIFELSKERDLISSEYYNGFTIIFDEGLPYFLKLFNQNNDINLSIVNTYLKLLASHPDSLVIRKSGLESALNISKKALSILEVGGISSEKGLKLTIQLDNDLQIKKGKLNPGTTADLISGVIFCALLFGLRF
ncbi:MAG: triphosphoribosyl-dephospho-CoA synthase [Promethearchaeota archaeon]|nr:MAG: triphosphoribosyl-dephospho-CoA synthase [Candidatus Lokiarchaeota archaeon]